MTVSSTLSRQTFACNGITTVFTLPFRVLAANEVVAYRITVSDNTSALLVNGVDFTVSGVGAANAIVTTTTAYTAAHQLRFIRATNRTQLVDYRDNDPFPAESHEEALDRLTHITQELDGGVSRALLFPEPETGQTLPPAASRAGQSLAFDENGNLVVIALADVDGVIGAAFGSQIITATAGQTVFALTTTSYTPGTDSLAVFVNGLRLYRGLDYAETSGTQVTMTAGLVAGDQVLFVTGRLVSTGVLGDQVSIQLAGSGTLARSATARAGDTRSIDDYTGADPTGATSSSAAAEAYRGFVEGSAFSVQPPGFRPMIFGPGVYELDAKTFTKAVTIRGAGSKSTFIRLRAGQTGSLFTLPAIDTAGTSVDDTDHSSIEGVRLMGNRVDSTTTGTSRAINCPDAPFAEGTQYAPSVRMSDVVIEGFTGDGIFLGVNRNWALLDRVIVRYCNDNGLASYGYDHRIVSSDFGVNKNFGFREYAGGANVLTGCNLYFNTVNYVSNSTSNGYTAFIGCSIDGANEDGVRIAGATGIKRFIGTRFSANSRAGANLWSDIVVTGASCVVQLDSNSFELSGQAVKLLLETTGSPRIMWGENDYLTSGDVPYATAVTNDWTLLQYAGARDARIGSAGAATLAAYTSGVERWKTADTNTTFNHPLLLPTYTVAGLPAAAAHTRGTVYVSNESGGAVMAFSDGTNWRRVTDRAIVS